ncbi:MAG: bifunctional diguanylate cyclase/phosphodiesterase [Lachnospiraceae bacterium]|nr:bifunctional diguanylate cyclase/phosphodiesterase [Lachnospiraceae bacterium]
MTKTLKRKTQRRLVLIGGALLFIALSIVTQYLSRIGFTMFNGVIMALQFAICLGMIQVHNKPGIIITSILLLASSGQLVGNLVIRHNTTVLPGLANHLVYLLTLLILARQNRQKEKMILTDSLTGVSNRRGLFSIMKHLAEDSKPFHIVYLTLENYKMINENFGHEFADKVIQQITDGMSAILKSKGHVTRLSGAIFVLVIESKYDVLELTDSILAFIREKKSVSSGINVKECQLSTHAGIASYPDDTPQIERLIRCADMAMRYATAQQKNSAYVYDKDVLALETRQEEIENLIHLALTDDLFYMVYQPQFKAQGKKLRGFESLIRLRTADGQNVSPGEFIPVAEKNDLVKLIDDYVLHRVLKETKDWAQKHPSLTISINISSGNVSEADFVEKVKKALEETGFPASSLEIEITEYSMVKSVDTTIQNIALLKELGIQIALDDFGTGYTSLSYLSKMPVNLLKIDKSLVDDIASSKKDHDFFNAVVSMGHLMGCEVISEGVETEEQLALIKHLDCDFVQGYIWGRPLSFEDAEAVIQANM